MNGDGINDNGDIITFVSLFLAGHGISTPSVVTKATVRPKRVHRCCSGDRFLSYWRA
ncbi:MAG: hypothetical protein ACI89L_002119 [Phycisphaerales bacterium]|jgi:hypothetical protein